MELYFCGKRKFIGAVAAGAVGLLVAGTLVIAQSHRSAPSAFRAPSTEKVIHFVRARFGIADTTQVKADEWRASHSPDFFQNTLTVDDGKPQDHKVINVYATKDGRYLGFGNLYALHGNPSEEIIRSVRQQFKVPENITLTAGALESSKFPGFYSVRVSANNGKGQDFYVTHDRETLLVGSIMKFSEHPEEDVERLISLGNQPSVGPAHASVTVVEYADLECPSCARMHQFLENELLPKYKDKIRVVFKEFPLVAIHQWALAGAVADECAYEIDPKTYLPYRTLIFQHQSEFDAVQNNPSSIRDLLLKYGQQVGLDSAKLAPCIDSKHSMPRVEEGVKEGQALNVAFTPTFFINGRAKVGMVPPEEFFRAVDDALRNSEKEKLRAESRR